MDENRLFKTQRTFRILLYAMSHPGKIVNFFQETPYVSSELDPMSGLFDTLETLLDGNVSFCVVGDGKENLARKIETITRSRVHDISDADFIVVTGGTSHGAILKSKLGSLEYPDDSATAIYHVQTCNNNPQKGSLVLKGPGIATETTLSLMGIHREEMCALQTVRNNYPCGIDLIFIDIHGNLACVPRSVTIHEVL